MERAWEVMKVLEREITLLVLAMEDRGVAMSMTRFHTLNPKRKSLEIR